MKKLVVVLIPLLVLALMLGVSGCCTKTVYVTPTPTPSPTPTPTPSPTPEVTLTPTPTPTPTATPIPSATPPPIDPLSVPCQFYGTVKLNGNDLPSGTPIKAIIEGYVYATTTPAAGYSASSYLITIPKAQGLSYEGKIVIFYIGSYKADQSSIWTTSGSGRIPLNLTATTQ